MFTAEEVVFFDEVFGRALDGSMEGHRWLVVEDGGDVVAAANDAPEPFADRMWNLYFVAVDTARQGTGAGRSLVAHVETALRALGVDGARVLIVETSSTEQYADTRRFYAGLGDDEEATIREFHGPGDHKVVFWKSLAD